MALRDFFLLALVCVLWASNNIVSKFVVSALGLPPLFFAAVRFGLVAVAVSPWLLPMPRPRWRLLAVALLMGALNFTLVFIGLKTATPSAVAVVSQVNMPITTILSMLMLGEQVHWRRGLGIVLTLAGALVVIWDPQGFHASQGLLWVVGSAFSGALGVVMMKQIEGVKPLQFQAWVGFSAVWPLAALSAVFEPGRDGDRGRLALPGGGPLFQPGGLSAGAHSLLRPDPALRRQPDLAVDADDSARHHRPGRDGDARRLRDAHGFGNCGGARRRADHRAAAQQGHADAGRPA
jgi:drug/metabolite transporter (DMT)-like permease